MAWEAVETTFLTKIKKSIKPIYEFCLPKKILIVFSWDQSLKFRETLQFFGTGPLIVFILRYSDKFPQKLGLDTHFFQRKSKFDSIFASLESFKASIFKIYYKISFSTRNSLRHVIFKQILHRMLLKSPLKSHFHLPKHLHKLQSNRKIFFSLILLHLFLFHFHIA